MELFDIVGCLSGFVLLIYFLFPFFWGIIEEQHDNWRRTIDRIRRH